jgi:DNA invertase Pin-like site-specific DNA recombinase
MLIGYARVSKLDQNPDLQRVELERFGCEQIIVEHGSGAKRDRPGLKQALALLRRGDTFVVWKVDRASRSVKDLIDLSELLEKQGVEFKSLHDPIDTSTAMGRAFYQMVGVFAELERSMIIERTKPGLLAANEKGHFGGRRRVLYGAKLKRAEKLWASGEHTLEEIAQLSGCSRSTAFRYLCNGGLPLDRKKRAAILERFPDVKAWLQQTNDPENGTNPAKRQVRAS